MMTTRWSRKQAQSIIDSTARINLFHGAVRSGKTYASFWTWLRIIREAPPGELLMWGRTERTLKRNILDPLAELLGPGRFKLISGAGEAYILGRRVYLAGANDERAEGKIRGLTLAAAYGDEVTLAPESFFTMLLSRLSLPGAQLIATTNPDNPAHWLKKRYLDRSGELDLAAFHFTLDDNPALDPVYVENLKREYTGLWHKRFIQGLWTVAEGSVYDMFELDRHVVEDLPFMRQYWVGIDYGTINPTVFLLAGQGVDNRLYIIAEWRWDSTVERSQMTDGQYSQALRTWIERHNVQPRWYFVDPSAASFKRQLYYDGITNVADAANEVLNGIRSVGTLLANDRLKIHASCEGLIEEMQGYSWDRRKQALGEDAPIKLHDHGPDCARYFVAGTRKVWRHWLRLPREKAAA